MSRKKARKRPARAPAPAPTSVIEERGLPLVAELARIARGNHPPLSKLEGAMEILFGAYGESDREFSGLFLAGWMRARDDKHFRLTLAWQREQIRLSLQDILTEGAALGAFRPDLDPGAVAAVILGTAEGCLLQTATEGGAVPPGQLVKTLLRLAVSGA
ncbi:MAG TPA: TetR family transcriptional regulator C-terminal domain-containing protein [Methylomirabilota bacterium]|nr:TetR family transcriptional regulator C-terminal domain-containing protein [Methylomirabilota bacterium]